jgi:hypothetical protein
VKNSVGKNDWGNCRTDAFYITGTLMEEWKNKLEN